MLFSCYTLHIYPGPSGPLSLAIRPWVGAMSTGDGFGHLWEETAPLKLRPLWRFINQFIKINVLIQAYSQLMRLWQQLLIKKESNLFTVNTNLHVQY